MFSIKAIRLYLALIFSLSLFANAHGQQSSSNQQSAPPAAQTDDYVTQTNFRNRVFEVRHRDPRSLVLVIRPLGSGFRGATMASSHEFRTITVRDFPENIATIEEALRRLDAPEAARPNIELKIHVLLASNAEGATNDAPAEVRDVLRQLQSTLNYRSYHLATSIVQRTQEGSNTYGSYVSGSGNLNIGRATGDPARAADIADYQYQIASISLTAAAPTQPPVVQIGRFQFSAIGRSDAGTARVVTDVGVRDGERVVIGTASLRDKALILILTARVIQ